MIGKFKLEMQRDWLNHRYHHDQKKLPVGLYYEHDLDGHRLKIVEAYVIGADNYVYDGWAFLLEDGYWRFGCPLKRFLFRTKTDTEPVRIRTKEYGFRKFDYPIKKNGV